MQSLRRKTHSQIRTGEVNLLKHQNRIEFNCKNYHIGNADKPQHCYNCAWRDGYPQNLGGDDYCSNFQIKGEMNEGYASKIGEASE